MSGDRLTDRQREILEFIREKIRARGYGPTVREIGGHFNITSPNGVMCHLRALEKKGLITREPNMSRAITLADHNQEPRGLPLAGSVAAGLLQEAVETTERVDFHEFFPRERGDLFVLKVKGDSMIGDQISDGDFAVIRKTATAERGQIVVAATDEYDVSLKRWYPEKDRIRLQPSNPDMQPIYVDNAQVLGVLVGVVRKIT